MNKLQRFYEAAKKNPAEFVLLILNVLCIGMNLYFGHMFALVLTILAVAVLTFSITRTM